MGSPAFSITFCARWTVRPYRDRHDDRWCQTLSERVEQPIPGQNASEMSEGFDTTRMEAFSDGVFAIAMTLLVFQIAVPDAAFRNLWRGIADQWPSYLAYATSFLTIGALWMVHHGLFRRMYRANLTVMRMNLLLLMTVAFLPFPTRLAAQAISRTSAERPAVLFYGLTLLAISVTITLMVRYVATRAELRLEQVPAVELETLSRRTAPSLAFYALALILALLVPEIAAFAFLLVAIRPLLSARAGPPAKQSGDTKSS
jgi:uncharacterized membrane protein